MIYNRLSRIPTRLFFEIEETLDYSLLSTTKTKIDLEQLWGDLYDEYLEKRGGKSRTHLLVTHRSIRRLECIFMEVTTLCNILIYDPQNKEAKEELIKKGYKIDEANISESIKLIQRLNEANKNKIEQLKNKLPKNQEAEVNIEEVFINYSLIMGIQFDFDKMPIAGFIELEKRIKEKVQNGKR